MRTAMIVLVISLAACKICYGEELPLEKTVVFSANKKGYKEYRIPVLLVTKQGTLLAITDAGRTDSDWGDRDLFLKRSSDGGKTWSSIEEVQVEKKHTCGNPCAIIDKKNGRIHLLFSRNYHQVFYIYSDDEGKTWTEPREITEVFQKFKPRYSWDLLATGPGRGIEIQNGRFKGRWVMPIWLTYKHNTYRAGIIYSDDRGNAWKPGGLSDGAINVNENFVYETGDGVLVMNMRAQKKKQLRRRFVAQSNDGGLTWTTSQAAEELPCPVCHASGVRYESKKRQSDGFILFVNPASEKQRNQLTVRLSRDNGKTWPFSRLSHAGPAAYSSINLLPDGDIGLLYEGGERHRYEKMFFVRFPIAWLENQSGQR
ncbi:MAG: exo-alpha-sialidase [Pirellulales bacterium]|nr:exo-alpha-sialidase [Pirellulales bacterium]